MFSSQLYPPPSEQKAGGTKKISARFARRLYPSLSNPWRRPWQLSVLSMAVSSPFIAGWTPSLQRPLSLDTTRQMHRRSMTCATTRTMSYSARLFSGRTTYCTLCCHRYPPRHNDTTSDNDRIHCSLLSIRLSCLIVIFWYACCTKILTDSCFYVCSPTDVGLRYVMPINKRTFDLTDLNPDKSEAIVIGTSARHRWEPQINDVTVAGVHVTRTVKSLGVMSYDDHIHDVCKAAHFYIRALYHLSRCVSVDDAKTVAPAMVSSRLDYCNSIVYGTSSSNVNKLQRVQNVLARTVMMTRKRDHITPVLANLHWLPVTARIQFKTAPLTFKTLTTHQPSYIHDLLQHHRSSRQLRSTRHNLHGWNSSDENLFRTTQLHLQRSPHVEHSTPRHQWQLECYSEHFQEETENVLLH